jgi:hypothetical protein
LFEPDELPFQLVTGKELTPKQQLEEKMKKQKAQQLYSQYLESLNKPNTNPILQGNQQEQAKKVC